MVNDVHQRLNDRRNPETDGRHQGIRMPLMTVPDRVGPPEATNGRRAMKPPAVADSGPRQQPSDQRAGMVPVGKKAADGAGRGHCEGMPNPQRKSDAGRRESP